MNIKHPLQNKASLYDIKVVLRDLASQEGCDGEPYEQMIKAADYIAELEKQVEFEMEQKAKSREQRDKITKRIAELEKELIASNDDLTETTHELGLAEVHMESIQGFFSDGENPAFEPFNEETLSIFWKKTLLEQQIKGVDDLNNHFLNDYNWKWLGEEGSAVGFVDVGMAVNSYLKKINEEAKQLREQASKENAK